MKRRLIADSLFQQSALPGIHGAHKAPQLMLRRWSNLRKAEQFRVDKRAAASGELRGGAGARKAPFDLADSSIDTF
jgi:hypothetical protein